MEDSEIISLFFARSEQAVAELDRQYGAAPTFCLTGWMRRSV